MRDYEFYYTKDGSIGLYSHADSDVYHSKFGALSEAWDKFILPSGIDKALNNKSTINILDLCYGVGYNTKAVLSYIINSDEEIYKIKNKNKFKNFLKNKLKNFGKNLKENINIDTIDTNNLKYNIAKLLLSIETTEDVFLSHINIDCLEINPELVKISPLLKTLITPQEIYSLIMPGFLDCFDFYWKLKKIFSNFSTKFLPQNTKKISELLNLKFNNEYEILDNNYRVHKLVNYLLIDNLIKLYKDDYYNKELKFLIRDLDNYKFFDNKYINYAKFKQKYAYNLPPKTNLFAFLHNIYYEYLSKRYRNKSYLDLDSLFDITFYINDARKTLPGIDKQYDYVFLDAFTYSKAPELWTIEFMSVLHDKLSNNGLILTYSNAAMVRKTFLENNFFVGKIYDKKSDRFIGTVAAKNKALIKYPLTQYEIGLTNTKAGIPYHDKDLNTSRQEILDQREFEFNNSKLLTASQYMKRRLYKKDDEND